MASPSTPPELLEAHRLLKAGQRQQAGAILKPYLAQHQQDARAWWLMAHAVSSHDTARQCLEQVLKIDPNNEQARARLATLTSAPGIGSRGSRPAARPAPELVETPIDEPDDSFFFLTAGTSAISSGRSAGRSSRVRPLEAAPPPPPQTPAAPSFEEFVARSPASAGPLAGKPGDDPFAGIEDESAPTPPAPRPFYARTFDPAAHARLGRDDSSDAPPPGPKRPTP
jgi:hypothetical protein